MHDGSINLDDDDAAKTGEYHPVSLDNIDFGGRGCLLSTTPLISQESRGEDIGKECHSAVYCCQGEDGVTVDAK